MELQNSKINKKTVAILGAGPSGLVAAREAIVNGVIPTVFEKQSDIGGIWNPETGSTWSTLSTNVSKFIMTFGDTDWPQNTELEMFPSCPSMFAYLNDYADKWKLRKYIKFECKVIKVTPVASNKPSDESPKCKGSQGWNVSWISGKEDDDHSKSEIFDGVIIASGIFSGAHIPNDIKGLETFPGRVIHSKDYKAGSDFENERVLVIGGSISGPEIAGDVSRYAKNTIHCFRKPFFILRRYLPDSSRNNTKLPIDLVFYKPRNYYKQLYSLPEDQILKVTNKLFIDLCQDQQEFDALKISPEDLDKPIYRAVSDQYVNHVREGYIVPIRQNILEINGSEVKFENGEKHVVDSIILATGFNISSADIFEDDVLKIIGYDQNDRFLPFILFNATLHPDLSNLFFVGMFKDARAPVIEQQARWACKLLSNNVALPPREVIMDGLVKEQEMKDQRPRPQFPHSNYVTFSDAIAKLSQSFPDLDKLQSDKFSLAEALGRPLKGIDSVFLESKKAEIYKKFMTLPVFPAHYNLVDNPEQTLNQINFLEQVIKQYMT